LWLLKSFFIKKEARNKIEDASKAAAAAAAAMATAYKILLPPS
jgi:hypothetical protein